MLLKLAIRMPALAALAMLAATLAPTTGRSGSRETPAGPTVFSRLFSPGVSMLLKLAIRVPLLVSIAAFAATLAPDHGKVW